METFHRNCVVADEWKEIRDPVRDIDSHRR